MLSQMKEPFLTVQSIIKNPLPLIVNSQILEDQLKPKPKPEESGNTESQSAQQPPPQQPTIITEQKVNTNKASSYDMMPMVEFNDWIDYPSPAVYPPLSTRPRYDYGYNGFHRPYHPPPHHQPFLASASYSPPPPPPPPPHPGHHFPPFDFPDLTSSSSSSTKSHIEEIALFIVVLTIAGLFGLLIAMFIPFILLLQGNRGSVLTTNSIVPATTTGGNMQGLVGKRRRRHLMQSLKILKTIHETSQLYSN
uniref:Uncharacterized protein n=1 Tax=Tetranychus urticae TaxID=32264 RepID=T1K2F8_TETUR